MSDDPTFPHPKKPLVSVQFEREVDISTGQGQTRHFVKMYFEARDSGLLAELPDDLWKLLCCVATYINENGHCFPSQERLADDLGQTRETINRKIKRLVKFRFQGRPIISVERFRPVGARGRWKTNIYKIHPITFTAFDGKAQRKDLMTSTSLGDHVTPTSQGENHKATPKKAEKSQGQRHTNKTTELELDNVNVDVDRTNTQEDEKPAGGVTSYPSSNSLHSPDEVDRMTAELRAQLQDAGHSDFNVRQIVKRLPADVVQEARFEAWGRYRDDQTRKPTAYFIGICKNKARESGIDLGFRKGTRPHKPNQQPHQRKSHHQEPVRSGMESIGDLLADMKPPPPTN